MSAVWLEFARDAMACRFEILLHPGKPENGGEGALEALDTITYLEQVLSVYVASSELCLINERASKQAVSVSTDTATEHK